MTRTATTLLLLAATHIAGPIPAFAQSEVKMITFSGATNVVGWAAIDKGFFEKEGLKVTADQTRGSKQQMQDLMAGKYQFASTSFDNVVAYTEGEGSDKFPDYDVVAILGVHSGLTSVVARPEIKTFADIKGKTVAVDSATSGYGTVLFKILKDKAGLVQDKDYKVVAVGGTNDRIKAMKDNTAVAGIVSSPRDTDLQEEGYNILAEVADAIGAYQGSVFVVRRSWAKDHEKEVMAFTRGIIAANDFVFNDKAGAIAVLRSRIKDLSAAEAEKLYKRLTGPGGLNRRAELNAKGVGTVLELRAVYGGAKRTEPEKYIDLSYYMKATAKK
ncbi:MAG TPA: ABC transporter substrate-binding protein [Hyphomicrobiaceae bacterium]|nr:ABC transporter substrate-binding protein [Hyphomicrobiaceae bacterium]